MLINAHCPWTRKSICLLISLVSFTWRRSVTDVMCTVVQAVHLHHRALMSTPTVSAFFLQVQTSLTCCINDCQSVEPRSLHVSIILLFLWWRHLVLVHGTCLICVCCRCWLLCNSSCALMSVSVKVRFFYITINIFKLYKGLKLYRRQI